MFEKIPVKYIKKKKNPNPSDSYKLLYNLFAVQVLFLQVYLLIFMLQLS